MLPWNGKTKFAKYVGLCVSVSVSVSVSVCHKDFWPQFSSNHSEFFFVCVDDQPRPATHNFGKHPETIIFEVILHH